MVKSEPASKPKKSKTKKKTTKAKTKSSKPKIKSTRSVTPKKPKESHYDDLLKKLDDLENQISYLEGRLNP